MSTEVVILGAGGHAKVVYETTIAAGLLKPIAFTDVGLRVGETLFGLPILGEEFLETCFVPFIIGFGGNLGARKATFDRLREQGHVAQTVIHPSAVLSHRGSVGDGTVAFAKVVVNADSQVGLNAILNTGCIVEHDCVVGSHTHIAPGAILTGGVSIGECTLVGAGSVILPGSALAAARSLGPAPSLRAILATGWSQLVIRQG